MKVSENGESINKSRRRFFGKASSTVVLTAVPTLLMGCNTTSSDGKIETVPEEPTLPTLPFFDRPRAITKPGRYQDTVTVFFEKTGSETAIYYSLDGFDPDQSDVMYDANTGITLTQSTTIHARAFRDGEKSEVAIYTYLVKKGTPIFSMVAFSDSEFKDIYQSRFGESWISHFDVLKTYMPNPDLIIGVGDLIGDNDKTTGWTHSLAHEVLRSNLSRTGMMDTEVLLSRGNHDAYVMDMVHAYPKAWFPIVQEDEQDGYYHKKVKNIHVIGYDSMLGRNSDAGKAQALFVRNALEGIKQLSDYNNEPIIVHGHHPLPGSVNNGAYNGGQHDIKAVLKEHPEVIHFSGHSHYTHTDERSVLQDGFTAFNCGSINYQWVDANATISDNDELVRSVEVPVWSLLLIEIYDDRVEVERIALAADEYYMRRNGGWYRPEPDYTDNELSPNSFRSAGALCGPTWVYGHNNSNVELNKYDHAYLDNIKQTEMPFSHNLDLVITEDKLRVQFDNIRGHIVPALYYLIQLNELNTHGERSALINQRFGAETVYASTTKRFNVPLRDISELDSNIQYELVITPIDAALGVHNESKVTTLFTLDELNEGDYKTIQ
ncbi:metallophosphoesterase [Photobacterium minamisatsumaniensis]|uniref:metallophosphoesterase n=1 Tax=Photobacterium minamisatsumaniensis TaxID=2910233 RepID=UPI003D10B152